MLVPRALPFSRALGAYLGIASIQQYFSYRPANSAIPGGAEQADTHRLHRMSPAPSQGLCCLRRLRCIRANHTVASALVRHLSVSAVKRKASNVNIFHAVNRKPMLRVPRLKVLRVRSLPQAIHQIIHSTNRHNGSNPSEMFRVMWQMLRMHIPPMSTGGAGPTYPHPSRFLIISTSANSRFTSLRSLMAEQTTIKQRTRHKGLFINPP